MDTQRKEGGDEEECSVCDVFRCFCDEIPDTDEEKKKECKTKVEDFIAEKITDVELDNYFLTFGKTKSEETIKRCNLKLDKKWGLTEDEIEELMELQKERQGY